MSHCLALIVAMTPSRVIGHHNRLPWHLPADLRYFKQVTMNKPIVMGRKTYDSIGRPLPHRLNVVLTRQSNLVLPTKVQVFDSINKVLAFSESHAEMMVIGGATVYQQFLPYAQRLYVTTVATEVMGDAYFPVVDWNDWQEVRCEQHIADDKNAYDYAFSVWERKV